MNVDDAPEVEGAAVVDVKMDDDTKVYLLNSRILFNQKDVAAAALAASNAQILLNKLIVEKAFIEMELLEGKVNGLKKLKSQIEDNIEIFHPAKHSKINEGFKVLNDHSSDYEKHKRIAELNVVIPTMVETVRMLGVKYGEMCEEFEKLIAGKKFEVMYVEADALNAFIKKHGEETIRRMAREML